LAICELFAENFSFLNARIEVTRMSTTKIQKEVELLKARLDSERLPRHVAIIMDGNGRWGERHGLSRIEGHRHAIHAVRKVVRLVQDLNIPYLSLFAFSTENAERPAEEVEEIFRLFATTVDEELPSLIERGVKVIFSGEIDMLPTKVALKFREASEKTMNNSHLTLNLCVFYSGRSEILRAVRAIAEDVRSGKLEACRINSTTFAKYLYHPELPDPDLLIRTSGEMRISNFLLWQLAYTELYFTDTLWPDFDEIELLRALLDYQSRERRFGRV